MKLKFSMLKRLYFYINKIYFIYFFDVQRDVFEVENILRATKSLKTTFKECSIYKLLLLEIGFLILIQIIISYINFENMKSKLYYVEGMSL